MPKWTRNATSVVTLNRKTLMSAKVTDQDVKPVKTVELRNPSGHIVTSKVTLVGSSGVGKTSLAVKFCRGTVANNPRPTVAADWLHQSVTVHNRKVNLQIWDTAGQERYLAVVPNFIRDSSGVLLVYDVTDVQSFTSLTMWLDMARKAAPDAVLILVANKDDMRSDRIMTTEDGEKFAKDNNLHYVETSATTGHNVDSVFYDLAERIVCSGMPRLDFLDNIKLTENVKPKKKCPC